MRTEFRIRRAGGKTFAQVEDMAEFEQKLGEAIHDTWPVGEPFRIARPTAIHDFGPNKPEEEIVQIIVKGIPDIDVGKWFAIQKDGSKAKVRARKVAVSEQGSGILQAALDQIGDEYTFFHMGPDEFDCSGLSKFCYAQVDIDLPHHAASQFTDPQVTQFTDRSKLKDGDLVFYDTHLDGKVSHVGIVDAPNMVVDASSTADEVVHRDVDANHVLAFGRVDEVNGPLD
jgi:cell wall-associated NlpC family hydrolase